MSVKDRVDPYSVTPLLRKHLIGDGYDIVFDLEKSHGAWVRDARDGTEYLDFYTFFASLPLGFNHPVFQQEEILERLVRAALHKPANSDAHTPELASFTEAFSRHALADGFRHLFFIEGGALAVENALKAAFDWKARLNEAAGRPESPGDKILHFREAFHGRSGYTLSLTNTAPEKTDLFPKFDWPRVSNPKLHFTVDDEELARVGSAEEECLAEIEQAFALHPHDIAAIIIEPIQGEGGDNHFRGKFLRDLRRIADERQALLIFDEVQTGFGLTGKMWAYEHYGVSPDILCFGKKSQVCGIMAGDRLDEVQNNVFHVSSRINSTWGGGLVDMARCEIILEAMEEERLVENAETVGAHLQSGLEDFAARHPGVIGNPRGLGLMCAFDCPDAETRGRLLDLCAANRLLAIACGPVSVRFRPPLILSVEEAEEGLLRLERSARQL